MEFRLKMLTHWYICKCEHCLVYLRLQLKRSDQNNSPRLSFYYNKTSWNWYLGNRNPYWESYCLNENRWGKVNCIGNYSNNICPHWFLSWLLLLQQISKSKRLKGFQKFILKVWCREENQLYHLWFFIWKNYQ